MIYLDWAATAIPQEKECELALKKSFENYANPSAKHFFGELVRKELEQTRLNISSIFGLKNKNEIIFTSGGTEANHIPLLAMMNQPVKGSICISAIEHSAISEQAKVLKKLGWKILTIPSNKDGIITSDAVLQTIQSDTVFVTVMAVNNETGAIQPIEQIGNAIAEYSHGKRRVHFHVDAVQAIGKIPFGISKLPIHSASFSGHKIGAMRGTGFLYIAKNIEPFLRGGGQENGVRAGTENLTGIFSLENCLKTYFNDEQEAFLKAQNLMTFLIQELKKINGITLIPESRIQNPKNYSPWILQFAVKQLTGEVLVRCLSEKHICISTGSACSSKKNIRPVLQAMDVEPTLQKNSVRVSIGRTTTLNDLEEFIQVLKEILSEF